MRLASEHKAILWHRGFKTLGVNALLGELAMLFTLLFTTETRDVPQEVPQSAPGDVAFVLWHPQWFSDDIGEEVAREAEVLEHRNWVF